MDKNKRDKIKNFINHLADSTLSDQQQSFIIDITGGKKTFENKKTNDGCKNTSCVNTKCYNNNCSNSKECTNIECITNYDCNINNKRIKTNNHDTSCNNGRSVINLNTCTNTGGSACK